MRPKLIWSFFSAVTILSPLLTHADCLSQAAAQPLCLTPGQAQVVCERGEAEVKILADCYIGSYPNIKSALGQASPERADQVRGIIARMCLVPETYSSSDPASMVAPCKSFAD